MKLGQNRDVLQKLRQELEIADHFQWYVTAHLWASLAADSGSSVSVGDAKGGILNLVTGATDNNEVAIATAAELFLLGADRPMNFRGLIQCTEPGTNEANIAFGCADAIGANQISDNGGAIAVANSGFFIYKLDGGTVWRCYSENNGTSYDTISNRTALGSAYQELGIDVIAVDATNVEITFFCDGHPLCDATSNRPIKHRLAYASATEMDFGFYAKTGHADGMTAKIDWIYGAMRL